MLKRMVTSAAFALILLAGLCCGANYCAAQMSGGGIDGGHALAPGTVDDAAPAQTAGGVGQKYELSWIAWSWLSTRWMLSSHPMFGSFANMRLAANARWVW